VKMWPLAAPQMGTGVSGEAAASILS
jgi:hypothetical protein